MNTLTEEVKKLILAGIGAAAMTAEKSKDIIEQLVEKGELTVEQGKVLNEELKHTIREGLSSGKEKDTADKKLEDMSSEELARLKERIEELQKKAADEAKNG